MGGGIRIDAETGEVFLEGWPTLGPARTVADLERAPRWARVERHEPSPGQVRCVLPDMDDRALRLRVDVSFAHGKLVAIRFFAVDVRFGDGRGWGAWSEERERARREIHARWLAEKGVSCGQHAWGHVLSDYDPRSGQSLTGRFDHYASDSLPWTPPMLAVIERDRERMRACFALRAVRARPAEHASRSEEAVPAAPVADRKQEAPRDPARNGDARPLDAEHPNLPLSHADALRLAKRAFGGDLVIVEEATIERPWGWVFSAMSPRQARSGAWEDVLVGLGCVGVDRHDASVHSFDSSAPPDHWADEYGRQRTRKTRTGWLAVLLGRDRPRDRDR